MHSWKEESLNKLKTLPSFFSSELTQFLQHLFLQGYSVILVGGATRDFLESGKLSTDLDFELRHSESLEGEKWLRRLGQLKFFLQDHDYQVVEQPYGIFQINLSAQEKIELSSARTEFYSEENKKNPMHKGFQVKLQSQMDTVESFKRRDFTLNAIGLEMGKDKLVVHDPFAGIESLKEGTLELCSADFLYDPVRFLRALRFKIKKKLDYGEQLEKKLSLFNLMNLTHFYFFEEAFKSGDVFVFFNIFFSSCEKYQIPISLEVMSFTFLKNIQSLHPVNNKEDFCKVLCFPKNNVTQEKIIHIASALGIKKKDILSMFKASNA
ncbi:MAG: hypothetical protein KBD63_08345 [Bacteriovoracaceae bacterium]|nr:hypothetical protein [Bacteriovoracaceae bacterium]